jgi:bisphosphoglycerate-independent phosphoglycerate mutase (AlkP superfamily)
MQKPVNSRGQNNRKAEEQTAHTLNPVPVIIYDPEFKGSMK